MPAARLEETRCELAERWPLIGRWLRIKYGELDFDYFGWSSYVERCGVAGEVVAAMYEQQIAYYEWRLERRRPELAGDRLTWHLVEEWTDTMVYCCRRSAAFARGDDPGEWVVQSVRRPDLVAQSCAITDEIIAGLGPRTGCDRLVGAGAA